MSSEKLFLMNKQYIAAETTSEYMRIKLFRFVYLVLHLNLIYHRNLQENNGF